MHCKLLLYALNSWWWRISDCDLRSGIYT